MSSSALHRPPFFQIGTPLHSARGPVPLLPSGISNLARPYAHLSAHSTNQTTIKNISPLLLLCHAPSLPSGSKLSSPSIEHEHSSTQRRLVRGAHDQIRLHDLGARRNVAQLFGGRWGKRLIAECSGDDGRTFMRNHRAEDMLVSLAAELVRLDGTHA
jgi:hypothetical protein